MVLSKQMQTDTFTLTKSAATAIQELMIKRELKDHALRVFISGSGCSGYQYGMALEDNMREQDTIFEQHGIKIVIDEISIQYLHGATVDYVDDATNNGFKIENPNVVSACGCGNSHRPSCETAAQGGNCGGCSKPT